MSLLVSLNERFHTHNDISVWEFWDSTARVLDPEITQLDRQGYNLTNKWHHHHSNGTLQLASISVCSGSWKTSDTTKRNFWAGREPQSANLKGSSHTRTQFTFFETRITVGRLIYLRRNTMAVQIEIGRDATESFFNEKFPNFFQMNQTILALLM